MRRNDLPVPERVRAWMEEQDMLEGTETLLCALSGGADSVCLTHLLLRLSGELGFRLEAAHYHHGIRGPEADRDLDFVRGLCRDWDIPLHEGRGDAPALARKRGLSLEEAARELRYAFLEETAAALPACRIATAHQAEDNAETMLLHLLRGTGLRGLGGIPPVRGTIVRPLLCVAREEVLAYLEENGLPHVEDSTNALEEGERNILRHRVIPVLRELNPAFARGMLNTASLLREDEACLEALAGELAEPGRGREYGLPQPSVYTGLRNDKNLPHRSSDLGLQHDETESGPDTCHCEEAGGRRGNPFSPPLAEADRNAPPAELRFSCAELLAAPRPLASRALRLGAERFGVRLEAKHVAALLDLASGSGGLAGLDLPGGLRATREFDHLRLAPPREAPEPYDIPLTRGSWTDIPAAGMRVWLGEPADAAKVNEKFQIFFFKNACICGSIHVRSRRSGDTLRPAGPRPEKSLKKWMIEERIPAPERETWPVLADGLGVLAVPGLGAAERFSAAADEADGAVLLTERI